jgi:hypothetical protein
VDGTFVSYVVQDYADGARHLPILQFDGAATRHYFKAKLDLALRANADLLRPAAPLPAFRFDGDPLNGIIAYLTQQCGGNVHDHRVVKVTSSMVYRSELRWAAKHSVDLQSENAFASHCRDKWDTIPHTAKWICFDFRDRRVVPTHYTI